jgi:uncharacterized protein YjbI with pentapeptide repeats
MSDKTLYGNLEIPKEGHNMANEEQLALLKQGVNAWNAWREKNLEIKPDLSEANLKGTNLREVNLKEANLVRVDLREAHLSKANLSGADLDEADLSRSVLGVDLSKENFRGTDLVGVNLRKANLNQADLRGVQLSMANLSGANLRWANLSASNLNMANLSRVDLSDAHLMAADLDRTNLSEATLSRVHFIGADLSRADLRGTILGRTDFSGANLGEADLSGATLYEVLFSDTNLAEAKGLHSCSHHGPSVIDHRTLIKSGKLPLEFLRGCGLPDTLIGYLPSLLNEPIQFYSCFISYSSKNKDFANRLHADLQDKGVRCWFAPEDLKIGDKFRVGIDESIRVYDKLLLILSEHSITSDWVEKEVETAMEKEREQKRTVLFPIRLDDMVMKIKTGWAADVRRTRHIGDFTRWKEHDKYQKAFTRLLRDLKEEGAKK